jgi:hypothetical protein
MRLGVLSGRPLAITAVKVHGLVLWYQSGTDVCYIGFGQTGKVVISPYYCRLAPTLVAIRGCQARLGQDLFRSLQLLL